MRRSVSEFEYGPSITSPHLYNNYAPGFTILSLGTSLSSTLLQW